MPKLLRITTVPISLKLLLTGQVCFMRNNGYEVVMVSADGKERKELIKAECCPHVIIPFTRKISPIKDLLCLFQLLKLILNQKPDIIHTHTPKAGLLGMLAAKICGVKLKIHTIAGLPLMTTQGRKRKLLILVEKLTYWAADYVLPNSNSIMSFVKENKFTKTDKLDMIGRGSSNGIDLKRFSKNMIKPNILENVKKEIKYNEDNHYVLAVGRVVRDKGIVELVNAFLEVRKTYENLKLVIVGSLEEERKEESLPVSIHKALKENKNIIHVNWSDEVEYYMCLADVLVHASYREGFPNVPLQAGSMECPVVCSEIPGNIDIITNNKTGLYFESGHTADLIEKLFFAFENRDLMRRYAVTLRSEIENKYSREYIHHELFKFYNEKLIGQI